MKQYKLLIGVEFESSITTEKSANVELQGYFITIGVNAVDIIEATNLAGDVALNPWHSDGLERASNRIIYEIESEEVEPNSWPEEFIDSIRNINDRGVFYCSGLALYGDAGKKKWWEFWKSTKCSFLKKTHNNSLQW